MPLSTYGLLKGRAVDRRIGAGQKPHYQIHLVDDAGDYRIAVNVKSKESPSELEYLLDEHFQHPITAELEDVPLGFHLIEKRPGGLAIDFIRGNFFVRGDMRPLPFAVPGPDNDLNEKIDRIVQRAMADEDAVVYAFGQRWGPEPGQRDKIFGFQPGNGIHDIHMNQGNSAGFVQDDGVWQDGALLIRFPGEDQWIALFLKFQSQSWTTDERTGHAIAQPEEPGTNGGGEPPDLPSGEDPQGLVRIVGALVNSVASPEVETVTLLNTSPRDVGLAGWGLVDKMGQRMALTGAIGSGQAQTIVVRAPMQLSNKGGTITLVDERGLKVDGVAYTREQAHNPGWTLVF